ncbi:MAG: hypothetical protein KDI68_12125 [Gammaproteobacteria bacterium]|nr:hypothetical protein [Gammaproteobacteria bacterium]
MNKRLGDPPKARSTVADEAVQIIAAALRNVSAPTSEVLTGQLLQGKFETPDGRIPVRPPG